MGQKGSRYRYRLGLTSVAQALQVVEGPCSFESRPLDHVPLADQTSPEKGHRNRHSGQSSFRDPGDRHFSGALLVRRIEQLDRQNSKYPVLKEYFEMRL